LAKITVGPGLSKTEEQELRLKRAAEALPQAWEITMGDGAVAVTGPDIDGTQTFESATVEDAITLVEAFKESFGS
jgi:hypothetical protein